MDCLDRHVIPSSPILRLHAVNIIQYILQSWIPCSGSPWILLICWCYWNVFWLVMCIIQIAAYTEHGLDTSKLDLKQLTEFLEGNSWTTTLNFRGFILLFCCPYMSLHLAKNCLILFSPWRNIYSAFVLAGKYEAIPAKWTTERCAICRWVEDWEYNKIIICNRYISLLMSTTCIINGC